MSDPFDIIQSEELLAQTHQAALNALFGQFLQRYSYTNQPDPVLVEEVRQTLQTSLQQIAMTRPGETFALVRVCWYSNWHGADWGGRKLLNAFNTYLVYIPEADYQYYKEHHQIPILPPESYYISVNQ